MTPALIKVFMVRFRHHSTGLGKNPSLRTHKLSLTLTKALFLPEPKLTSCGTRTSTLEISQDILLLVKKTV